MEDWGAIGAGVGSIILFIAGMLKYAIPKREGRQLPRERGGVCDVGESNRKAIGELQTAVSILRTEVEEFRRQLDESFIRVRSLEAIGNQLLVEVRIISDLMKKIDEVEIQIAKLEAKWEML